MLATTLDELDAIRADCKAMVTRRAALSAGVALIPLPGLDLGTDVAVLLRLIPAINHRFGLSPAQIAALEPALGKLVWVGIGSVGSEMVGRWVSRQLLLRLLRARGGRMVGKSLVKFVPVLGQAVAAGLGFSAMKLAGDTHVDDCYAVARHVLQVRSAPALVTPGTSAAG
ncbi:protein of unknown function [Andreprevotia lacus DSM 23236]|uniref:DUF697 domain-containing protein n=1 Tax=Andreprevotia lacus DSM 23236 TaxID=1121001 RepID=A0A1W1X2I8_9NEIS|nr:hypothetical protein [Andreprevotia lacus]SMC17938.1 protein of unknown function [Andreprevotia lacus DSM 23236]